MTNKSVMLLRWLIKGFLFLTYLVVSLSLIIGAFVGLGWLFLFHPLIAIIGSAIAVSVLFGWAIEGSK